MKKKPALSKMKQFLLSFILVFVLFFSFSIPIEYCHAVGMPSFWTSPVYPQGLIEDGNADAGIKGNSNEYAYFATSTWTQVLVDLHLGNLVTVASLIQFPGTLLPMSLSLTYSSLNSNVDIGLGKGWTSNLHSCVSEDSQTHNLTFVTGSGAKLLFTWDDNNSVYVNPSGFTGSAVKNQNGTYTIQTLGGQILTFSSNGKLFTLSSRTGGELTVGYDGSGRPETLTDTISSREITLTWSQGGQVSGITDNMNNTWLLSYDGNANLVEIQQPSDESPDPQIHTSFGYDSNHKMTSQTDFEGFTYAMTYHASGYQSGKVATFVEPTANSATTEFLYEEDVGGFDKKTTMTDGEERDTYFFFSDTSLHLEKMSAGSGGTERKVEYDYNNLGLVSVVRDSYGKETTLSYDDVGHIETISYPPPTTNGTAFVREFIYTPPDSLSGKLTKIREKVTSSVWAETELAYTDQDAPWSPSLLTDPLERETTIDYNADKQPVEITTETETGTKTVTIEYSETTGNATSVTDEEGNETTIAYNNNGLKSEWVEYEGDAETGLPVNSYEAEYDSLSAPTLVSNLTTDQQEGLTRDHNGATLEQAYMGGCLTLKDYVDNTALLPRGPSLYPQPYLPSPITSTSTRGHTSTFGYDEGGALTSVTDYLERDTVYTRDAFGSVSSVTDPFGQLTEYTYDNNAQPTEIEVEGVGTYTITRNDRGEVTSVSDPIKGTLSYTYNVRGDTLTSPEGSYSRDILGQATDISYTGGGEDTFSYTPEGWLSSLNDATFVYDLLGNMTAWSDGTNSATLGYIGTGASSRLGLPGTLTGSGDCGSYSYTYNAKHWLSALTDSGKNQSFSYTYNEDSTLSTLQYPNQVLLEQSWDNKALDTVTVSEGEDTYFTGDATLDGNDQMTEYSSTVYAGENNTFSESYDMTYDSLHRLDTLVYGSNSKTLTYSYSSSVGKLTSIMDSILGDSYDFSYDSKGRLSSVVYPGSTGTSSYTYNDTTGQGRLEEVTYPGNRTMTLTWDGRDRITEISLDDDGTVTDYILSFSDLGKLKRILIKLDGLTQRSWNFSYGPFGIEKAVVKNASNQVILTQDYTIDPSGTILSMTYTPTESFGGTFSGELYFSYDNCGNLVLMTSSNGDPQLSYAYDRSNGNLSDAYNPGNIENIISIGGQRGEYTLPGFGDDEIRIPEHPGQIGQIGTVYGIDISAAGASANLSVNGPCGDVGTCGSDVEIDQETDTDSLCFRDCWNTKCKELNWGTGDFSKDKDNLIKYAALKAIIHGDSKGRTFFEILSVLDPTKIGMTFAEWVYDKFRISTTDVKKAKVELEILTDQANFIHGSKFGQTNLQANWDMFWSIMGECARKCPRFPGGGKGPGTPVPLSIILSKLLKEIR